MSHNMLNPEMAAVTMSVDIEEAGCMESPERVQAPQCAEGSRGKLCEQAPQCTEGLSGKLCEQAPQYTEGLREKLCEQAPQCTEGSRGKLCEQAPQCTEGSRGKLCEQAPQCTEGKKLGELAPQCAAGSSGELYEQVPQCAEGSSEKLYPNCDASVWLRSCEEEIADPIDGKLKGSLPAWLRGSLLRNGPGSLQVGEERYKHLFDSAALLHRYQVSDGRVRYQCRFLRSRSFERNRAAQRIVVDEFGTRAAPDPCRSIFDRVSALFRPDELSDNAMISLYPFGDELYAFTEGPVIHRVDTETLETSLRRDLAGGRLALVNHTSHPHVMPNGDVYNVGMSTKHGRLQHVVVHFPFTEKGDMFESARVVARLAPRWPLHPAYMHSFGVTENYFVIVEQPLAISLPRMLARTRPLANCLRWFPKEETNIVLLRRSDGRESHRFRTRALFFLHVINACERDGEVLLDLCAYRDPAAIDAMYVDAMENMQSNANYAEWFRARPRRLRLPLAPPPAPPAPPPRVRSQLLADVGCETPTIHYAAHSGRPYRYFYAISSDVDADIPGMLVKVDTETEAVASWGRRGCYPSEPIFVAEPGASSEDSGVLLSALLFSGEPRRTALLVLDARTMEELARADFCTPSPAPKCLHGWFLPNR